MDVSSHFHHNDGAKLFFTVGVFSNYAWVEPLQSKRGEEVCGKLERGIGDSNYKYLQADKGTELRNIFVQHLL